jgi:hypothetical protein
MAIRFTCSCGLTLEAEDEYAGQATVCPQCGTQKRIPSPQKPPMAKLISSIPVQSTPAADPGFEVVDDDEPVVARPKSKPRPALTMRGDGPGRRRKAADFADDDRPRRRPRDDDEEDDRPPRRKTAKRKASGSGTATKRLWKILGGIGLLLVGVGILVVWWITGANHIGRPLVWAIVAIVAGLAGIGTGTFGNVDTGSDSDYDSDDDDD